MDSGWQRPPFRIRQKVRPHKARLHGYNRGSKYHSRTPSSLPWTHNLRRRAQKSPSSSYYRLAILHVPVHQPQFPTPALVPSLSLRLELHNLPTDATPPQLSTLADSPRHRTTRATGDAVCTPLLHFQSHAYRSERPDTSALFPRADGNTLPRFNHPVSLDFRTA